MQMIKKQQQQEQQNKTRKQNKIKQKGLMNE